MARFKVSKPYSMSREDVRSAAQELANTLQAEYGMRYRWQGDRASFSRSGVDGELNISDDTITLSIKLGMLASAFERPLKQAIHNYLDEHVS
jgi:putative polyhydroxyalkanoate system protein